MAEITKSRTGTVYQIAKPRITSIDYSVITNSPIVEVSSLPSTGDNDKLYKLGNDLYVTSDNGTTWTYINGSTQISQGMTYKGLIDYCCDTLTTLEGLTSADHGLQAGDTGYCVDTNTRYMCAGSTGTGSTWTATGTALTNVGDFYIIEFYYGYYLDGKTYHGEVQAQIITVSTGPLVTDLILDTTEIVDKSISASKLADFTFTNGAREQLPTAGTVRIEDYVQETEESVGWLWQIRPQSNVTLTNPTQAQINALGKYILDTVTIVFSSAPSGTRTFSGFMGSQLNIRINPSISVTTGDLLVCSQCICKIDIDTMSYGSVAPVFGTTLSFQTCTQVNIRNITVTGQITFASVKTGSLSKSGSNALPQFGNLLITNSNITIYGYQKYTGATGSVQISDGSQVLIDNVSTTLGVGTFEAGCRVTITSTCATQLFSGIAGAGELGAALITDNRAAHTQDTFLRATNTVTYQTQSYAFGPIQNNSTLDLTPYMLSIHPLEYRIRYPAAAAGAGYFDRRKNQASLKPYAEARTMSRHSYGGADVQNVNANILNNSTTWEAITGALFWYTGRDRLEICTYTNYDDGTGVQHIVTARDDFEFWASADTATATRYVHWVQRVWDDIAIVPS